MEGEQDSPKPVYKDALYEKMKWRYINVWHFIEERVKPLVALWQYFSWLLGKEYNTTSNQATWTNTICKLIYSEIRATDDQTNDALFV